MGLAFPQKSLKCCRTSASNPKVTHCIGPGSHPLLRIPPHMTWLGNEAYFPDRDRMDQKAVTVQSEANTTESKSDPHMRQHY